MSDSKILYISYIPLFGNHNNYIVTQFLNFFNKTQTSIDYLSIDNNINDYNNIFLDEKIIIQDKNMQVNKNESVNVKTLNSKYINQLDMSNIKNALTHTKYDDVFIYLSLNKFLIIFDIFTKLEIDISKFKVSTFINFKFENENINIVKKINEISTNIIVCNEFMSNCYKKIITKPLYYYYGFIPNIKDDMFKNSINDDKNKVNIDIFKKDGDILIANLYSSSIYSQNDIIIKSFIKLLYTLFVNGKVELMKKTKLLLVANNVQWLDINQVILNIINDNLNYRALDKEILETIQGNIKCLQNINLFNYHQLLSLAQQVDIHINTCAFATTNYIELLMEQLGKIYIYPNITSLKNHKYITSKHSINKYVDIYNTYSESRKNGGKSYVYNCDNVYDVLMNVYNLYIENDRVIVNKSSKFNTFISKYNYIYEIQQLFNNCGIKVTKVVDLCDVCVIKDIYNNGENDNENVVVKEEEVIDVSQINDANVEKNKELLEKILEYEKLINSLKEQIQL